MGYDSSIRAVFGGDLSDLRAKVQEAQATVAKLNEHGASRLEHHLLGGLIGAEALNKLKEFTGEAIKDAQKIREEMEKAGEPVANDVRTLAEFGDGLKDVHDGAVSAVGFLVGGFTQLGDLIGSAINRLRGVSEAQENMARSSARAADEQEKALKKLQAANSPEKLEAAEKKLEEVRRRALMSRLSDEGKLVILLGEQSKLQQELSDHAGNTVAHKEIEAKLEENMAAQDQLRANFAKKDHEENKRKADEMNRVADERSKLAERQHEFALEQLSDQDRLIALKKDESELQKAIALVGKDTELGVQLGNELLTTQVKIRETNLAITQAQASAEKHVAAAIKEQHTALGGVAQTSKNFGNASTAELQELLRRKKNEAGNLRNAAVTRRNLGTDIQAGMDEATAGNIQKELDLRAKFSSAAKRGPQGVEALRRDFQGDPLAFDRLLEQFTKGNDKSDKMLHELEKLNGNVSGLFKNQ